MIGILLALTLAYFGFLFVESWRLAWSRRRIPLRIHVNGTRGKSSVCRLVGAGLRAGGMRAVVKTTGSAARLILEDARELPVLRPGPARIVEQLRMLRIAAARGADAIVLECMALQPYLQYVTERLIVRAHIAVITNVRPDHLDVMGPDTRGVAEALSGVMPDRGTLVLRRGEYDEVFAAEARRRSCRIVWLDDADVTAVRGADLEAFCYVEHAENVALALAVCESAGVRRETALEGMTRVEPDPGALRLGRGQVADARWVFADAFAANDPQSTAMLWEMLCERFADCTRRIVLLNCRSDRLDRSRQLGALLGRDIRADRYVLTGSETRMARRAMADEGLQDKAVLDLDGLDAGAVVGRLMDELARTGAGGATLVVGIGNIKGVGEEISQVLREGQVTHG